MIPFNLNDIKELANQSSFDRGRSYYTGGCVKKIIKKKNGFEGVVSGTSAYTVTLDLSESEPIFECTCPYDFDGICKHSVALAMAVLDGQYEEKQDAVAGDNKTESRDFKADWENADTQKKLNFHKQLLEKDKDLQNQFASFVQEKNETPGELAMVDMSEIKESVHDELCAIDFDSIVEDFDQYENGYYDDEGYIDNAYAEITEVLDPYFNSSLVFLKKGNLPDGIRVVFGMYEGLTDLPDLENNEYEVFDDNYRNVVLYLYKKELNKVITAIENTVFSDEFIHITFDQIIQRFDLYLNKITEDGEIYYDMHVFEGLLISLANSPENADYLMALLKKNNLECYSLANVLLKIAESTGNEQLWFDTSESYAGINLDISMRLLEKYKTKNDKENFIRIAELAFKNWPDNFSEYLIQHLDKVAQKTPYVESLKHYTSYKQSTNHYKELREYLSVDERKNYVDKVGDSFHQSFYINLLAIEERYSDILAFAKKRQASYFGLSFEEILKPIANIYPCECFEIIKERCDTALNSTDRKRRTYQYMTGLLKVMTGISSKQNEAKQYIKSLYNHKPNLPALKDELKKQLGANFMI